MAHLYFCPYLHSFTLPCIVLPFLPQFCPYLQEGDDALEQLEHKAIGELREVAGVDPSQIAMKEVLGYEQEFILAR